MSNEFQVPKYQREVAVSLICACYREFGSNLKSELIMHSILEDSLGELPDSWNVGLFRFLDEAVYLFRFLEIFAEAALTADKSTRSRMILCHQIGKNLLAIRVLSAAGLDGSARQNLRGLYEMCLALCRCLIDPEFELGFADQSTLQSSNEFYHRFMAKQRTEKFLKVYNDNTDKKCPLVLGNEFESAYKILGLAAHPNFAGWFSTWQKEYIDPIGMDAMFSFGAHRSSEFVLSTACHLALSTISFVSSQIADFSVDLGLMRKNPGFKNFSDDIEALNNIGKISGLMFIFLAKWTNRNKPHFDPQIHI